MRHPIALSALFLTLLAFPALAEDKVIEEPRKLPEKTYSPDYCDFTATFPEKPDITRKCENDREDSCYDLISYTKVFDNMDATVRAEIICNPSSDDIYKGYNEEAMKVTVRAMTKDSIVTVYDASFRQEEKYKIAGLVGKGHVGLKDSIFIAQFWSSPKSVMSVKAELIGEQYETADSLFATFLKSIGYVPDFQKKEQADKEQAEKDAKDATEPKDAAKDKTGSETLNK